MIVLWGSIMKKIVLSLTSAFFFISALQADPILTFFFRNYPAVELAQSTLSKMRKPNAIAKRSLEGLMHHNRIAGIFSSYYGFLNVSGQSGQTSFPRKQSKGDITIVIIVEQGNYMCIGKYRT